MKTLCKKIKCDILNGRAYKYETNTFNLVIFIDAVSYTKSGNKSMWAVFSTFVELPPILRSMSENIIFHSSWTGTMADFDIFLKIYNSQIDDILKNGVDFQGVKYIIKVHMLIADAPARSKACNTTNFNGKFGCLKCLHPTISQGQGITIYPTLDKLKSLQIIRKNRLLVSTIEPFTESINLRTNDYYKQQLAKAISSQKVYEGIKGPSHLSKWFKIPDAVYLDKMHLCDIGTFKSMFNSFFDPKKSQEEYYLG